MTDAIILKIHTSYKKDLISTQCLIFNCFVDKKIFVSLSVSKLENWLKSVTCMSLVIWGFTPPEFLNCFFETFEADYCFVHQYADDLSESEYFEANHLILLPFKDSRSCSTHAWSAFLKMIAFPPETLFSNHESSAITCSQPYIVWILLGLW